MSSSIESVTISSILDKRLLLDQSSGARLFDFGSTWTKLRIGLRMAIEDTGANIAGTPRLFIGVLSNPAASMANGPLTGATSHFWGKVSNVATWTRTVSGPTIWYDSVNLTSCIRIGATNTLGATSNSRVPANPTTVRIAFIVSLWKGTDGVANWVVGHVQHGNVQLPDFDVSLPLLKQALATDLGNPAQGTGLASAATVLNTAAVTADYIGGVMAAQTLNEAVNGPLNSLCVGWSVAGVTWYDSEVLFIKEA